MLIGAAIIVFGAMLTAAWLLAWANAREISALRRAIEGLSEGFDRRADIAHERDKSRAAERQIEHEEEGRRAIRLDRSLAIIADEIHGVRAALLERRSPTPAESPPKPPPTAFGDKAPPAEVSEASRDTAPIRTINPPSAPPESAVTSTYEGLADDRPSDGEGQRTTVMMRPDPNLLREAGIPLAPKSRSRTVQALPPAVARSSPPLTGISTCSACNGKGRVVTTNGLITCAVCNGKGTLTTTPNTQKSAPT